ncbi:MAG: phosphoribosylanthranilate isomerase [Thermacetogeniaceae bacterium]|nr:phosphoribosylanthranilate isomerase [Syntrophomonadaceae bacterium]
MKRDGCRVKICGISCLEDRELVYKAGADYFGVIIDVPYSPRRLGIEAAADLFKNAPLPGVALVFQQNKEQIKQLVEHCQPQVVQFLSPVSLESLYELKESFPTVGWWQSLFLPPAGTVSQADLNNLQQQLRDLAEAGADAVILDTVVKTSAGMRFGGTGQTSDWELARSLVDNSPLPVFLAGGINPSNVRNALDIVHPDGIDLCSGVEAEPGRKDPKKLFELLGEIRKWEKENTERVRYK